MGWLTPEQLTSPADRTLVPLSQSRLPVANTHQQAYLLSATNHNLNGASPSPSEFFVMEYRKRIGWDAFLPGEGLLFWHINYNQTAWDNNTVNNYTGTNQTASSHMRVYLKSSAGNVVTPGNAFTSGSFTPLTWSGTNLNRPITNIVLSADNIRFQVMGGAPPDPNAPMLQSGVIHQSLPFKTLRIHMLSTKMLNIKTTDITGNLTVTLSGNNANSFSVSTTQILANEANSPTGTPLSVTFSPKSEGKHTATLTISGGGLNPAKVIELSGDAIL